MSAMNDDLEVTVDGVTYKVKELNQAAQDQVANIQFVDKEIVELQSRLAVCQTARNAYQSVLQQLVPRLPQ